MGGTVQVDIGHGRGWLAPAPAASVRRIDAQLGRAADINEAGRSPEQADENRRRWLAYERYLNGGPWAPKAPYALGAAESVHCWGYAADTDDSYDPHAAAVWEDNGWIQTALYPHDLSKNEPWHREYNEHRDNHRNDPAPSGKTVTILEDTMSNPIVNVVSKVGDRTDSGTLWYGRDDGTFQKLTGYSRELASVMLGSVSDSTGTLPLIIPTVAERGGDFDKVRALWREMKKRS